jgi:tetratricopeptide (TPR) repeat protein
MVGCSLDNDCRHLLFREMIMAGWNGGLSFVLVGLLVGGGMPGLAEPGRVAQAQSTAQNQGGAAQQLIDEGLKLFRQGSKESLQQALVKFAEAIRVSRGADDKPRLAFALVASGRISSDLGDNLKALEFYTQALPIWRAVGNRSDEATTLNNIGLVYSDLGEKQKALEFYNQALHIQRAVGDRSGEAATLNNTGSVYNALGEKQKALEFYNQALPISRAVGNRSGEATTLSNIGLVYSALGEKQKALDFYNQALPIRRAVGDRSGVATTLSNIGAVYFDVGEKQKALEFFNQALPIVRAVGNRSGEATTLHNIGRVYSDLGENQKALEFYNQALPIQRAVGDRSGEATTLNNTGSVYNALGENQKALEFYDQALPISRAVGDRSGEATTLTNIGSVYSALGEKQKALEFYDQALPISRAVGNRSGEATTLTNIGLVYDDLGEKQKALEFYNQSLPILRAVGDRSVEAATLNNIGRVYSALGEKQKALDFYNQALPIRRAVGDRSGVATTLSNIGAVYSALGEKQKALEFYNQALPILRAVGDRSVEASTLNHIGNVYSDLGEKQKALEYYNQALPIRRAVGDRSGVATTLSNIGLVYSDLGEEQKALEFYNQALPILRAVGDRLMEATTLNNIGNVYSDLGEKQKALEFLNQALPILRAVGDRSGEATTLWNVADTYRDQNRLSEALTQINAAITLIEQLRSNLKDPQLKTSYFATVQGYYQFKIDLLMQLHQQNSTQGYDAQSFETSDQSRARTLRDLLTESRAKITRNISPALQAKENNLQTQLIAREKQFIELSGKPKTDSLIQQLKVDITNLLRQQQDLASEIRRTNPDYAKLQYPTPTRLADIQQQLTPNTLLLQYSLGAEASYLWVVSNSSITTYKLPKNSDLEASVKLFQNDILDPFVTAPFYKSAQALTQQILGPAANQLSQKRLLIVPDGVLHKIPLAALAQPGLKDYKPLLETHEITYLPAASLIFPQYPDRPLAPKTIALLADPIFSPKDDRLPRKTTPTKQPELTETIARDRAARSLSLARLPGTAIEAKAIASLVPESQRTIVTGFDSNYPWVTNNPKLNQYRYLHLATHGIFDQERPELSSLILSLYTPNGEPQKGFLRLPDLFNLDLPTEMVTLSACQTGLGNSIPGEGLVGMTRGLMYAGAKRVTVSLWDVPDDETAQLMQQFYRNLFDSKGTKMSHSAALRSAQLQMWQQGIHPYYWSAFVMQGEWRD